MLKEFNDWDKNGNHIRQFINTEDLIIEKKWDAEGNLIKHEKMDGNSIPIK